MFLRALGILAVVAAVSIGLTWYFGETILLALGLILSQLKFIAKKLAMIEWPAVLIWLKTEAQSFFRIELIKKWFMSSLMPLLLGSVLLRRIGAFVSRYKEMVRLRYQRLIDWYRGLDWHVKGVATLILLFGLLGLTVSSLGLWLILFSVKLPLWILAGLSALWQMTLASVRKMAFKTVAFLQLAWLWRGIRRLLPASYLERKRRLDFRMARMVVRRRRMTLRELSAQKDSWAMRFAVLRARLLRRDR